MSGSLGSLVLAVDAGQTGTLALLARLDGEVVGVGRGAGCDRIETATGRRRTSAALTAAISGALGSVDPRPERLAAAYLGLTAGAEIADQLVADLVAVDAMVAESDVFAALASGTRARPGVAVIAGTGSVAVALSSDGSREIRGGWGHLLGDQGGGYWLAMRALQAAAAVDDGRLPPSRLERAVLDFFGAPDMRTLSGRIYAEQLDRSERAALAAVVLRLAGQGDPLASTVVDEGAVELARLVLATIRVADITDDEDRVIVTAGGLLGADSPLLHRLADRLAVELPDWRIVRPPHPPVVGALYLALITAGHPVDDPTVARIDASLAAVPDLTEKAP